MMKSATIREVCKVFALENGCSRSGVGVSLYVISKWARSDLRLLGREGEGVGDMVWVGWVVFDGVICLV